MWGRCLDGLPLPIESRVRNPPLILLDEIDKVSTDYKGDTFSALLEVLDPGAEKGISGSLSGKYRWICSEVVFPDNGKIRPRQSASAHDRMEVIEVSSYTGNEKLHIATEHLIPKQLGRHGLSAEELTMEEAAVWRRSRKIIRKKPGVRQLERKIGEICRKTAKKYDNGAEKGYNNKKKTCQNISGGKNILMEWRIHLMRIGIVRGLAWTSVGGDTLQIRSQCDARKGELLLTGQLGDVMKRITAGAKVS